MCWCVCSASGGGEIGKRRSGETRSRTSSEARPRRTGETGTEKGQQGTSDILVSCKINFSSSFLFYTLVRIFILSSVNFLGIIDTSSFCSFKKKEILVSCYFVFHVCRNLNLVMLFFFQTLSISNGTSIDLSVFCKTHGCGQHTLTNHATPVAIGRTSELSCIM